MSKPTTFVYDPGTREFQDELWDVYRTMRDEHPVFYDAGRDQYVLTRFDDVWWAVHDHDTFSSNAAEAETLLPMMIYMDPPRHTALRALVSRTFTPRRVADMEATVRSVARGLLDTIEANGVCEVQHEYAAVLPSVVIARMIGVPDEHVPAFREWTEWFIETAADRSAAAAANIYGLFAQLLAERRAQPRDDLMSALIGAEVDGQKLTDEELLGFCLLLILAGNDTTSTLIGTGTVLLARDVQQRARLVRDPSLWPVAVEELVRLESPAQVLPRTATREVTRHGVTIPKGARVALVWGAANHDEREFPDPERFDVTRAASRHLGFGHGAHYCLGSNLARLEARVAFDEWHARIPDYELSEEPTRLVSVWARGFGRVPVRFG